VEAAPYGGAAGAVTVDTSAASTRASRVDVSAPEVTLRMRVDEE